MLQFLTPLLCFHQPSWPAEERIVGDHEFGVEAQIAEEGDGAFMPGRCVRVDNGVVADHHVFMLSETAQSCWIW